MHMERYDCYFDIDIDDFPLNDSKSKRMLHNYINWWI